MNYANKQHVVNLMKSSKNAKEWDKNASAVRKANGGKYPRFWYESIVSTGLCNNVLNGGDEIVISVINNEPPTN